MSRSFVTTSVPIFVKPTDSDVPVFTKALHRAATGDPSSGQTLGFPLAAQNRSFLAEDPILVRPTVDSTPVLSHLLGKPWSSQAVPEIRIVPLRILTLGPVHKNGLLDVAVFPESKKRLLGEIAYYTLRRSVRRLRTLPLRSFVLSFRCKTESRLRLIVESLKSHVCSVLLRAVSLTLGLRSITQPLLSGLTRFAQRSSPKLGEDEILHEVRGETRARNEREKRGWMGLKLPTFNSPTRIIALKLPHIPRIQVPNIEFPKLEIVFTLPHVSLPSKKRVFGVTSHALLATSIVLFFLTVAPIIRLEAGSWWLKTRTSITGKAEEPAIRETLTDTSRPPDVIPPEDKQFQLLIPKIGANMKVIANVDPNNEEEYTKALKEGVAHAKGTNLPGEPNANTKTVYIFGHSTNAVWNIAKYNALFYSLKDMESGDPIIVWYWGKEFTYITKQIVKVDPNDVSYFQPQTKQDQLILQTCWPPGTTWKRLLVIATPAQT